MDIDPDRWLSLLAAYRNSVDASPPFMLLQEAQSRWARARADLRWVSSATPRSKFACMSGCRWLEDFEARGAVGRRDHAFTPSTSSPCVLRRALDCRCRASSRLTSRSASALGEEAQHQPARRRRRYDHGHDRLRAAAVRMPTPSSGREFAPSVAPRQGGTTAAAEPPTPRVQRGTSGVVRTMSRVWP
jgi:hypothetical protein